MYVSIYLYIYTCMFILSRNLWRRRKHARTPSGFTPEHVAPRCFCARSFFPLPRFFRCLHRIIVGQWRLAFAFFSGPEISITGCLYIIYIYIYIHIHACIYILYYHCHLVCIYIYMYTPSPPLHGRRQITQRGQSGDAEKSAGVRAERIYRFAGPVIRYSRTNVRDIN